MLTIYIPTKNRSEFIIRQLYYLYDNNFNGWIFIGDSSNEYHLWRTKKVIDNLRGKLKIMHFEYPNTNIPSCLKRLVENILTPYGIFIGDDDFLVPCALNQCVEFLKKNSDYGAVHGHGVIFTMNVAGNKITKSGEYKQGEVKADTAGKRLIEFMQHYFVPLFSVCRTDILKKMFKDVEGIIDETLSAEILPCCISAICGKIKEIDCLSLIRQDHSTRNRLPDPYDWITNKNWLPSFRVFRESLKKLLIEYDCISGAEADTIVKTAFELYLKNVLDNKSPFKKKSYLSAIKDIVRPYISWIKRPPYYKDFMNVYDSTIKKERS